MDIKSQHALPFLDSFSRYKDLQHPDGMQKIWTGDLIPFSFP